MTNPSANPIDVYADPSVWLPRLERVLDDQAAQYQKLDALSQHQSELIASGAVEDIIGVLAERQVVIDRISKLNEALVPFRAKWDELANVLADEQRERLRERLGALDALVKSISERDEADRAALERRRSGVRQELSGLNAGRQAVGAYAGSNNGAADRVARYQDRSG